MSNMTLRATAVFVALATSGASLLVSTPTATAATTVQTAASAFQLGSYTLTELPGSGDITTDLKNAVARPGTPYQATVVHLSARSVTVSSIVRPANYVYIVAEPGTTVTWKGGDSNLLRFESKGRTTGGVYGGKWDGGGRSSALIHLGNADVRLAALTVASSGKYGVGAYNNSLLSVRNVSTTGSKSQGVYVEGSRLEASGLRSTNNKVNGVQLSKGSVGTIADSFLDNNGQGVKGTTDGKTGHGLGVASATAFVSNTSMSRNKVCGASLTGSAKVQINANSHLDNNGRHGLGTEHGTTATISDSSLNNNGYNGALASGKGTTVTLQRVTIDWARQMALSVPSGGTARVTDSVITRGQKYTIAVSSKSKLFLLGGNTVSTSHSHGIVVSGKSAITISGTNNLVTGSRGDGLRITGSGTTGRIEAPASFTSNRDSGVVVVSKAKLWMVRGCEFAGNRYNKVEKRSGGKLYVK